MHSVAVDGVYCRYGQGQARLHFVRTPTPADIAADRAVATAYLVPSPQAWLEAGAPLPLADPDPCSAHAPAGCFIGLARHFRPYELAAKLRDVVLARSDLDACDLAVYLTEPPCDRVWVVSAEQSGAASAGGALLRVTHASDSPRIALSWLDVCTEIGTLTGVATRAQQSEEPRLDCRFYRTAGGAEPVRDWRKDLPANVRKEIGSDIQVVQWRWPIGKPLVDGLGEGLYEVRSLVGDSTYRVLFCIVGSTMALLHGFQKKRQKTPKAALEVARSRQREAEGRP
jgi:phage-related protein